jgi:hypothetical protein
VFFTPFVPFFDPRIAQPSTPTETYLIGCSAAVFTSQPSR